MQASVTNFRLRKSFVAIVMLFWILSLLNVSIYLSFHILQKSF